MSLRHGDISREQVLAVVPVIVAVPTGVVAYRVWERYQFAGQFDDYLPLVPRIRRHLRALVGANQIERIAGPENYWKRREVGS